MKNIINLVLKRMERDNVSEFSAECSYYIILSFIPFLILLLTLIQYTGLNQNVLYSLISRIIPNTMNNLIIDVIQEVYSKSIGTISISLIFILWSAGRGLYALIKGLNAVYEIKEEKVLFMQFKSIINTMIFLVIIIIAMILSVFNQTIINSIKQNLIYFNTGFWEIITEIWLILFTFLVYILIFKYIPKHKVTFKSQIPGALIGSISLNIVSFIFSKYLVIFKNFSIMYGSLTTIILIMMWTYTCIYTIFLGAEINKIIKIFKII